MVQVIDFPTLETNAPSNIKRKVPRRKPNADYRSREYLTEDEVGAMLKAVSGRNVQRDKLLILMLYRHGLRLQEATNLRWSDVDLRHARLHVHRLKNGLNTAHPIQGDTLRLLRAVRRRERSQEFVFVSERGSTMAPSAVRYVVRKAGNTAGLKAAHPHQLRHGCGYHLANNGVDTRAIQEYLGHKSITHTTRYTQLNSKRFVGLWD